MMAIRFFIPSSLVLLRMIPEACGAVIGKDHAPPRTLERDDERR
jgi:hypothetical protein